jgi:uncharacterized protein (TIGR00156 family)
MKKIFMVALLSLFGISNVFAGGFSGHADKTSIAEALKRPDDSYVTVEGNIVKKISSDKYLFKDASGSMTVEIDNEKWGNLDVSEKDILELSGEIEREFNSVHLDVDTVKKLNK